ncbi:MAG: hypothetical protein E5Y32_05200 [Mesorhizobium sp.]|nr:MAG: hypothetical protein E5Y32_05200 [Mesorhizobium sp.]
MKKFILQLKQFLRGQPASETIDNEWHDASLGPNGGDRIDACRGDNQSLAREGDHQPYGEKAWDELSGDRDRDKPHIFGDDNDKLCGSGEDVLYAAGSKDYLTAGYDSRFQDPMSSFDPRLVWQPHIIALVDIKRDTFIFYMVGSYRDDFGANSVDTASVLYGPASWFYNGKPH